MPKLTVPIISIILAFSLFLSFPQPILAATPGCDSVGLTMEFVDGNKNFNPNTPIPVILKFDRTKSLYQGLNPDWEYDIVALQKDTPNPAPTRSNNFKGSIRSLSPDYSIILTIPGLKANAYYNIQFVSSKAVPLVTRVTTLPLCTGQLIKVGDLKLEDAICDIKMPNEVKYQANNYAQIFYPTIQNVSYKFYVVQGESSLESLQSKLDSGTLFGDNYNTYLPPVFSQNLQNQSTVSFPKDLKVDRYTAFIVANDTKACGSHIFKVSQDPVNADITSGQKASSKALPKQISITRTPVNVSLTACNKELAGVETAIGCIPTEPAAFINGLVKYVIAIGGGIALLLMIFGAIEMITSQGNDQQLKSGQERFTNAIVGLLFIIFSVFLLQVIGADILNLPGFSSGNAVQQQRSVPTGSRP